MPDDFQDITRYPWRKRVIDIIAPFKRKPDQPKCYNILVETTVESAK